MLRLLGSAKKLCDGVSRRDFLQVGGLGAFGVGLSDLLRLQEAQGAQTSTRSSSAKACILLFPYGSPAQHETFDPKPDAPVEIQGEMKAISTSVPGVHIGEGLPKVAEVMDRLTLVRSMTHSYPLHGVAYAVSGLPKYSVPLETRPRDSRHWPFIGSVVDYLEQRRTGEATPEMPRNVGLPWQMTSKTDIAPLAGPYAAFLGQQHDPVWTDFVGKGTKIAPPNTETQRQKYHDPHMGITSDGRFQLSPSAQLSDQMPSERLALRRSLLSQFERSRRALDRESEVQAYDKFREMAFSLLSSNKMRTALDISREPMSRREKFGMTVFGQGCLAARRLVEAGCKFVTVFWDCYGEYANGAWDTHQYHYPRLKECLLPGFDAAYSGLILDLEERGMLDETLVMSFSEHGRTPKLDEKRPGGGRGHWSQVYSAAFAGGGIARGNVVGSSDSIGGEPHTTPVSPKDILATAFHLLGINPRTTVPDHLGRPLLIAGPEARVRREMLG